MRNEVKSRYTSGRIGNWKLAIGRLGNLVFLICVICGFFVVSPRTALANDVRVTNVSLSDTTPGSQATVTFRLSQQNPFGSVVFDTLSFSDYIWVFIKYSTTNGTDGSWNHAILAAGGSVTPVTDNYLGAFIQSSAAGTGTGGTSFNVRWNYGSGGNGLTSIDADTLVKVCAIEMAEVPAGSFYYNAGSIGVAAYNNYNGAAEILVSATTQIPSGAAAGWPNGYSAFYMAKYEVSQQQYCDFLNTLSTADATTRWPSNTTYGYLIVYNSGAAYGSRYTTTAPNRACNWLNWDDLRAYCSWTALRPMTEMEFEKAARGTQQSGANKRTYPWGNTAPDFSLGPNIDGATHTRYYGNFNSGGSSAPILVGWYLSQGYAATNKEWTGASPYGITDLAGNNWEHMINCAWSAVPVNGNGTLTGFGSWPTAASGKGLRGGDWGGTAPAQRVSARSLAGYSTVGRETSVGFRPARTK